jgi:diguanylate cyclase (GGDEF)-like protein
MRSHALPLAPPFDGSRRLRDCAIAALTLAVVLGTLVIAIANSGLVIAEPRRNLYEPVAGAAGWLPWAALAVVALLGSLVVALAMRSRADRVRLLALSQTMQDSAGTDWLTGLYNRRALTEQLTRATAYARRHGEAVSVMMIDLDAFTETNDLHGRGTGDEVLRAVSECMRAELRADDVCGRWGGDEFLIIMPAIDELAVRIAAERLRAAAARLSLDAVGMPDGVQLSIGTATGVHTSPDALERAADFDLRQATSAKRAARASAVVA